MHFYWYLVGCQLGFAARKQVGIEMNLFSTSLFRIQMFLQLNRILLKCKCPQMLLVRFAITAVLSVSHLQDFTAAIGLVLHVQNLKLNVCFAKMFTAIVKLDARTSFKSIYKRKSVVTAFFNLMRQHQMQPIIF